MRSHLALGKVRQPNFTFIFISDLYHLGNLSQFKMKFQLSFVFFFYLLHCSFGNITEEPDEFCDEGPPGKYCLEDLSGWHDCHVDPSTGKMVDKIYSCPANTRWVRSSYRLPKKIPPPVVRVSAGFIGHPPEPEVLETTRKIPCWWRSSVERWVARIRVFCTRINNQ